MKDDYNNPDRIAGDKPTEDEKDKWWEKIDLHVYFELAAILSKKEWDELQTLALNEP